MKADTICGANAVSALFARRPNDVLRLFYAQEQRVLAGPFCAKLAENRLPYRLLPPDELARAAGTTHHGGICAVAKPRQLLPFDPANPPDTRLLLVLDGIGNPHNLGAIARSAAFFGLRAMLLHDVPGAAMPSDAAYRTAEGGMELLTLYRTRDLAGSLTALSTRFRVAAAVPGGDSLPVGRMPRDRALALVLGHEEHGVSAPVLQACRRKIRIEGGGMIQSLNVAQATAVLLHALTAPSAPQSPAEAPA